MKVLIVVDMLNDFLHPEGALYCGDGAREIIPYIRTKIEKTRAEGGKVIYICDAHDENDKEFEMFPKHCVKGTWGAKVIDELAPTPEDYIVEKTRYSGFYNSSLEEILKKLQPKEVDVVGVCTSICVMDTVGGLRNRDYKVNVYVKGVADFDAEAHRFSLKRMKNIYGANIVED